MAEPIIESVLEVVAKRGNYTYSVRFLCSRIVKVFPIDNVLQKDRIERRSYGFRSISGEFRRNVKEAFYRRIQQVLNPLPLK